MTHPALRWTIGDVSDRGFELLRLSVWGAHRLFGPEATYIVCVNTIPVEQAVARTGALPAIVQWRRFTKADIPPLLAEHLDRGMAEGVGWKLAPLRLFPDRYELSLDNDCVLWNVPSAMRQALTHQRLLFAEDVAVCLGQFAAEAGNMPRNSGIRGLPPGYDLEAGLRRQLERKAATLGRPVVLSSELDEQGLQAAAMEADGPAEIVPVQHVTICSPFHPHRPELGTCGAHFVGSNARHIAWDYYDRPADDWMREHWTRHRDQVYRLTGTPRD